MTAVNSAEVADPPYHQWKEPFIWTEGRTPDLWETSRATYSQTMGHKMCDLQRRISSDSLETEMSIYCCNWPEFSLSESVKWKYWEDIEGMYEGDVSKQQRTVTNVHGDGHRFETKKGLWGKRPELKLLTLTQTNTSTFTQFILAFCSIEEMNKMPTYHFSLSHTHTTTVLPLSSYGQYWLQWKAFCPSKAHTVTGVWCI